MLTQPKPTQPPGFSALAATALDPPYEEGKAETVTASAVLDRPWRVQLRGQQAEARTWGPEHSRQPTPPPLAVLRASRLCLSLPRKVTWGLKAMAGVPR